MFIDSVKIKVEAGKGGDGIIAFRREKCVEEGGPFGGSGGKGGDVIFEVDPGLNTLLDFNYNKKYKANNGENGKSKGQHGKNANDLILKVPPGTMIYNNKNDDFLADLVLENQTFTVAHGGRGGRGNLALAKAGRHSLEICENGEPGEELEIRLELKLLADVGLVGLPSVGKSTLISVLSNVKPKIAEYHFTTITPNLGVCKPTDATSFVIADLPGLIEGASLGKGLGYQFLKHIQRTKVICHVLDMQEDQDPIENFEKINKELEAFDKTILDKKQIVVANKMDLPGAKENLEKFKQAYPNLEVIEISALQKEGINLLKTKLGSLVESEKLETKTNEEPKRISKRIYRFEPFDDFHVSKIEDHLFEITGNKIKKLVKMTNFNTLDNIRRFSNQLKALGVYDELEKLGIENGDYVRIYDYELEYEN